jgi:hypothetical protein
LISVLPGFSFRILRPVVQENSAAEEVVQSFRKYCIFSKPNTAFSNINVKLFELLNAFDFGVFFCSNFSRPCWSSVAEFSAPPAGAANDLLTLRTDTAPSSIRAGLAGHVALLVPVRHLVASC